MLSSVIRAFSNTTVMGTLRDAALAAAKEFVDDGMKQYYTRWGNHVYDEGVAIKDPKKFEEYTKQVKIDLEAIERQAKIQKIYVNIA